MRQENIQKIELSPAFLHNSLPMVLCDKNFLFIDVNEGAEDVLGYQKEELYGKSILDITAIGDLSFDFQNLDRLIKGEKDSYTIKRSYLNQQGEKVQGSVNASLITIDDEQYILGIFYQEVEKIDEVDLLSSEHGMIGNILSINPDIHYIMDIKKREYVYQNIDILGFFGYCLEDIKDGQSPIDFLISKIDPESIHQVQIAGREFRTSKGIGEFVEVEYRFLTKTEGWKWLRAKTTPLVQGDKHDIKLSYGIIQDITERKLIEEQLQNQESFITQIANLLPDVINVFDVQTLKNVYTNLSGRTFLGFTIEEWETQKSVQEKSGYNAHIKRTIVQLSSLEDDDVFTDEAKYYSKDGEEHWLWIKAKVFKRNEAGEPVQILAITTDVSAYKRALHQLDVSEKTTVAILDAIPDLLMVIDKDGYYKSVFEGVDLKDTLQTALVGKNVLNVLEKTNAEALLKLIQTCIETGETKRYTFRHDYEDERPHAYFSNYLSRLNSNEVLILARDETSERKMQIALDEKVKQLSDQNEQMEEFIAKNSELERFAYIISHDLKEPLRSISAITELIKMELNDSQNNVLNELLNHLTVNNKRMEQLIQGVLDYSRVESDGIRYNLKLGKVVKAVLKDLRALINDRNVEVEVQDLFAIRGDETQITQLFQNLISNAIKFNESKVPRIVIGSEEVNGKPTCFIKDNGIGIPDDFKENIFKMFKRVNTYDQFPGQGLGLSICKKIIDKHYGKIWIEDNDFRGSTFYFSFD